MRAAKSPHAAGAGTKSAVAAFMCALAAIAKGGRGCGWSELVLQPLNHAVCSELLAKSAKVCLGVRHTRQIGGCVWLAVGDAPISQPPMDVGWALWIVSLISILL